MRVKWLLLCGLYSGLVWAQQPAIGLIIDDLGNDLFLGRQAVALPGALTYSILPHTPYADTLAREANTSGKEVMVHLPMAAESGAALGPGGLSAELSESELRQITLLDLQSVPFAKGVNNHMGSLLTRQRRVMGWFMATLQQTRGLYFVDSRTDVRTVAERLAKAHGIPASRRDVFLDNERDATYVLTQLERLIAKAFSQGTAIGIAHPHPETLRVLNTALPELAARGVELLPISRIIDYQRRPVVWHASSSPSLQVVKNSKP